jgi:hypothetical protein
MPDRNIEIQLSPNPFHDKTLFSVENNIPGRSLQLLIIDVFGKKINQFEIENSSIEINLQAYSPGIYFYKLMHNDEPIASGKMIYVK